MAEYEAREYNTNEVSLSTIKTRDVTLILLVLLYTYLYKFCTRVILTFNNFK